MRCRIWEGLWGNVALGGASIVNRVALIFYYLCRDFIEINEAFCIYLC